MGTFLVGLIVLAVVVVIIRGMIADKRSGKSIQCGGECRHCGGNCGRK